MGKKKPLEVAVVESCKSCKYWVKELCLRNPPHPRYGWAKTIKDDWCGDWIAIPITIGSVTDTAKANRTLD